MKNRHYTLIGLTLAALVFAVIVVAGLLGEEPTTAADAAPNGSETPGVMPSGHPPVDGAGSSAMGGGGTDYSAMIEALEKKFEANPGDAEIGLSLADAYLMNENADKAIALYDKLLKADPDDPTLLAQLAMAWHVKGDDGKARGLLDRALSADPESQAAHYNLAIIYFADNETAKAKREWETVASIDPKSRLGMSAQNFVDLMEGRTPEPTSPAEGQ